MRSARFCRSSASRRSTMPLRAPGSAPGRAATGCATVHVSGEQRNGTPCRDTCTRYVPLRRKSHVTLTSPVLVELIVSDTSLLSAASVSAIVSEASVGAGTWATRTAKEVCGSLVRLL